MPYLKPRYLLSIACLMGSISTMANASDLELSDSEKYVMSPELVQDEIDTDYASSIAEYSVILAEAASSVSLAASTSAQETIDSAGYTTWKATYKCTYSSSTSDHTKEGSSTTSTYYTYPTKTGSFATSIDYDSESFTDDGSTVDCPVSSISFY